MIRFLTVLGFIFNAILVFGQVPLTTDYFNYNLIDRYEITSGQISQDIFTSVKPYNRLNVVKFSNSIKEVSASDQFNHQYLLIDNGEFLATSIRDPKTGALMIENPAERKALLGSFYSRKNALYYLNYHNTENDKRFNITINPIIGLSLSSDNSDSLSAYRNSRGFALRGSIGGKVGFFSRAIENQYRFPNFIRTQVDAENVVTGGGLHKPFGQEGEDFFTMSGYITFAPIKEIMIQFGHDRNFIGNGYRSLILSDQAKEYPFLKINTRVWKFNYTNLFMEHVDFQNKAVGRSLDRKFSALHHLSFNVGKNLNIGIFENIVFDRQDSNENNRYEIQYLNPVIFYRAVEHGLNSTDNAMLGLDWKWNFLQRFQFYGQFIWDEFVKNEFVKFSDNWVNKWAYQAGVKYINVANINNLDLQLELNHVRPFVYSHRFQSQNWAHYNQELAHPLGANFRELIVLLRYQPYPKWNFVLTHIMSKQGIDSLSTTNINGANILISNADILNKDHAPMFQGVVNTVNTLNFHASYMFHHNFFLDAAVLYRNQENALSGKSDNMVFTFGLRLNTEFFGGVY